MGAGRRDRRANRKVSEEAAGNGQILHKGVGSRLEKEDEGNKYERESACV